MLDAIPEPSDILGSVSLHSLLFVWVVVSFAVALAVLGSNRSSPLAVPLRSPVAPRDAVNTLMEQQFYGMSPSRLILYAPPGFKSTIDFGSRPQR